MFEQMYYISPHAVQRFKERIANLPTRKIREIILEQLQNRKPYKRQMFNHKVCPVYRCWYDGKEFFVPVIHEKAKVNAWPVVTTILLKEMELNYRKGKG